MSELSNIEGLLQVDNDNVEESKRYLQAEAPTAWSCLQRCSQLIQDVADAFGSQGNYDQYQKKIDDLVRRDTGDPREKIAMLEKAVLIGETEGKDHYKSAQTALFKAFSVVTRSWLFMRLRRDYDLGLQELLKLRVTPARGYLRLQSESAALIVLMGQHQKLARTWLDAMNLEEGQQFHDTWHKQTRNVVRQLGLNKYYEEGSAWALHSRVAGVGLGVLAAPESDRSPGSIGLSYQEISKGAILLLHLGTYLRAHETLIGSLVDRVPEIPKGSFNDALLGFTVHVNSAWGEMSPRYEELREKQRNDPLAYFGDPV